MSDNDVDPQIQALQDTMERALQSIDQSMIIATERLTFIRNKPPLGCGSYGKVVEATLDNPSNLVAVKELYSSRGDRVDSIHQGIAFVRELKVWTKLSHPHLLRLIGFMWDAERNIAFFVTSREQMSLFRYLKNAKPSPYKRLELACDTSDGIMYLHEQSPPICHGDISSRNVLITADLRAKICDFGLSKVIEETSSGLTTSTFHANGVPRNRAPELDLPCARRTLKSDMWAWSCVAFEIFTDRIPYDKLKDNEVTPDRTKGQPPAVLQDFDYIEPVIRKLLLRCWISDPEDRPEIRSCFNDLVGERSRLQALVSIPEPAAALPVDREAVLQAKIDVVLESLTALRIKEHSFSETDQAFKRLAPEVHCHSVAQPFGSFTVGQVAVVKKWRYDPRDREEGLEKAWEIVQLLKLWSSWEHQNLVALDAFFLTRYSPMPYAVMTYATHDSLESYLKRDSLNQVDRVRLALGTAKGVAYLHSRKPPVYHGNLTVWNVVVDSSQRAKLCGFTFTSVLGSNEGNGPGIFAMPGPPESFLEEPFLLESDIWGWAILCAMTFALGFPGKGKERHPSHVIEVVSKRDLPYTAEELSTLAKPLKDLLIQCWRYFPDQRPSIHYALNLLAAMLVDLC